MASLITYNSHAQITHIDTLAKPSSLTQTCGLQSLSAAKPSLREQLQVNERTSSSNYQRATRDNSQEDLSQEEDTYQLPEGSSSSFSVTDDKFSSDDDDDASPRFSQRKNPEFRSNYINRLVSMKVMDLNPKKKTQNIFVFDWDDTLFCTSYLGNLPLTRIPAHITPYIEALDATASKILLQATKENQVFIITNSDGGWVEKSASQVLPKTYQVITRRNVKVISARSKFQPIYPNDMCRWKLEAFLELQMEFERDLLTNIVVMGDSEIEIQAGKALSKQFKNAIVKTIKFKESPKIEELIKEHKIILKLFDEILSGPKNMTVKLGKN